MTISVISTVLNESDNIKEFIESILSQTLKPDEIIIVDGGSTDGTVDVLKQYPEIKIILKNRVNISQGRNIGIRNAKGEIIAVTDAGCILREDWLQKIVQPFKDDPSIEVVGGYYYPYIGKTLLERAQAALYLGQRTNSPFFSPSSRSIAFKKGIWEKIGGYPEWLQIGEDTYFNRQWKMCGARYVFVKDAIVYWRMRKKWVDLLKQHFRYGIGGGMGGDKIAFLLYPIYLGGLVLTLFSIKYPIILYFLIPLALIYLMKFRIKRLINIRRAKLKFYHIPIIWIIDIINNLSAITGHIIGTYLRIFKKSFRNAGTSV